MVNLSTSPNLLYLATTGWRYVQDVYWLMTAEGAKDITNTRIERLRNQTALVAQSPAKGKQLPSLPTDVQPTLEKINNIIKFMIPACEFLGLACHYGRFVFLFFHEMTSLFSVTSLTCLAIYAFFETLKTDLKEIKETAICMQRKFDLIMGKDGSLKKIELNVRVHLTKVHIGDAIHHVKQLSKSLYFLNLKYLLGSPIKQTESHLRALDQRIISP